MTLKIFGYAQSRTARCLWMAQELRLTKGIEYEHDGRLFMQGPERDELVSLNPFGKVPVINSDGFVLWESMAINLYLSKKYDCLSPGSLEEEALAWQWSFWVMTAIDSELLQYLRYKFGLHGFEADEKLAEQCIENLRPSFEVLDRTLQGSSFLISNEFSVADLNVASVFMWARFGEVALSDYPALDQWLTRCVERKASQTT